MWDFWGEQQLCHFKVSSQRYIFFQGWGMGKRNAKLAWVEGLSGLSPTWCACKAFKAAFIPWWYSWRREQYINPSWISYWLCTWRTSGSNFVLSSSGLLSNPQLLRLQAANTAHFNVYPSHWLRGLILLAHVGISSDFGFAPWQQSGAILAIRSKRLTFRWSHQYFHINILYLILSFSPITFCVQYIALI